MRKEVKKCTLYQPIINIDTVQRRSLKYIAYQEFKTLNNAIMITVEFAQRTRFNCQVNCHSVHLKTKHHFWIVTRQAFFK